VSAAKIMPVQFGTSDSANFEDMTWTFQMPEGYRVYAGQVAIVPADTFRALVMALEQFVAEKVDYMQINHLGNPEETHTVKWARVALAKAGGAS
jgi:hypothetical protein